LTFFFFVFSVLDLICSFIYQCILLQLYCELSVGIAGSASRLTASLLLVSGRDGSVLRRLTVPDSAESYYSPVIYRRRDNTDIILFGTGGETHRGALWALPLSHLYAGDISQVRSRFMSLTSACCQEKYNCIV